MSIGKCLKLIAVSIPVTACSYTFVQRGPSGFEESRLPLEDYAEAVFKAQNRLHSQMIELSINDYSGDPAMPERIDSWEDQLILACNELNGIAIKRMKGEPLSFGEKMAVRDSAAQCDEVRMSLESSMRGSIQDHSE